MTPDAATPPAPAATAADPLLDVRDLRVHFRAEEGLVRAVDGLSFTLERGRTLAIVGESGSGKSVTSRALMGLSIGAEVSGEVRFAGRELLSGSREDNRLMRGNRMAMIFQDPLSALHPFYTVGAQIVEAYRVHNKVGRKAARAHAVDLLGRVGFSQPERRIGQYPHEFSGGMRQRVMIAMALACDPELIIADEPTTALDVTVQAQILDLLGRLQDELGTALILITHDLGVVASVAHDVLVMYAGRAVERGTVDSAFYEAQHPYTWGLLGSVPRMDADSRSPLTPIAGSPPSLSRVPAGCPFHPRCPHRMDRCSATPPETLVGPDGHGVACHLEAAERTRIWTEQISPRLSGAAQ